MAAEEENKTESEKGIKKILKKSGQEIQEEEDRLEKLRLAGEAMGKAVRKLFGKDTPSENGPAKNEQQAPATQNVQNNAPKAPAQAQAPAAKAPAQAAPFRKISLSSDAHSQTPANDVAERAQLASESLQGIKGAKASPAAADGVSKGAQAAKASVGSPANSPAAKSPSSPSSSTSGMRKPATAKLGR